jgi:hypothetical protein
MGQQDVQAKCKQGRCEGCELESERCRIQGNCHSHTARQAQCYFASATEPVTISARYEMRRHCKEQDQELPV